MVVQKLRSPLIRSSHDDPSSWETGFWSECGQSNVQRLSSLCEHGMLQLSFVLPWCAGAPTVPEPPPHLVITLSKNWRGWRRRRYPELVACGKTSDTKNSDSPPTTLHHVWNRNDAWIKMKCLLSWFGAGGRR